jgi:hypothetical protein
VGKSAAFRQDTGSVTELVFICGAVQAGTSATEAAATAQIA